MEVSKGRKIAILLQESRHVALRGQRKEDAESLRLANTSMGFIIGLLGRLERNLARRFWLCIARHHLQLEYTTKAMSVLAIGKGAKGKHPVLVEGLRFTNDSVYPFLSIRTKECLGNRVRRGVD